MPKVMPEPRIPVARVIPYSTASNTFSLRNFRARPDAFVREIRESLIGATKRKGDQAYVVVRDRLRSHGSTTAPVTEGMFRSIAASVKNACRAMRGFGRGKVVPFSVLGTYKEVRCVAICFERLACLALLVGLALCTFGSKEERNA